MAKKRKPERGNKPEDIDRSHTMKLRLTSEELKEVRVAAAIMNKGTGELTREMVLVGAQKIIKDFQSR